MRDELLALLEDGPHGTTELAQWLNAAFALVAHELRCMQDGGLVRRINRSGERVWVMADYVVPAPPTRRRLVAKATPQAPPAIATSPALAGPLTYIIDGQEYESTWSGRGPLPGAGDSPAGLGSTLNGHSFHVARGRR